MVPFKENEICNHQERRRYNYFHSSARMTIEHAFGMLKSQWQILSNPIRMKSIEKIINLIEVSCILHNMCIDNNCTQEDLNNDIIFVGNNYEIDSKNNIDDSLNLTSGVQKRLEIVDRIANNI